MSKQLFGIVTGVRCLEQEQAIVTTHAGDISNPGGHLKLLVTNNAKLSIHIKKSVWKGGVCNITHDNDLFIHAPKVLVSL